MKKSLLIIRLLTGFLFIFSGLIKANDPLGLSYKMQEFFEAWGWLGLDTYTLTLSMWMNTIEVVMGVSIILCWHMKWMTRAMLALIVFFTFLTGYALFSGKIKTCGCFGDCLPLTPVMTFTKDLILLAFSILLTLKHDLCKPLTGERTSALWFVGTLSGTIWLQQNMLSHLPRVDCLPYKVGKNILEQMKKPVGSVPDSTVITYRYKKNNSTIEFDNNHFPDDFDSTYTYIDRYDKIVRRGSGEAPIPSFALLTPSGYDTTKEVFASPSVLFFLKDLDKHHTTFYRNYKLMAALCKKKNIPLFVVTAVYDDAKAFFEKDNVTILKCDVTIIKTAARANPTYFWMDGATIKGKYSYVDVERLLKALN